MGKGTIISHIADGQYNVTVNYDTSAIDARITILQDRKTLLETELSTEQAKDEPDEIRARLFKLQILSVEKQIAYLQNTSKVPADFNTTAWCADYTLDLSGEVGLIEIGREKENGLNIQPGYDDNADFTADRDGQLVPLMAQDSAATFYNLAMLPGFQKWKPMYRYGTLTSVDYDKDTCNVTLDSISSSQQGLNINESTALTGVPIEYMDCNSAAFTEDDKVVVKFTDYDIERPVVIGFQTKPRPCACWIETWDGAPDYNWTIENTGTVDSVDYDPLLAVQYSFSENGITVTIPDTPSGGDWIQHECLLYYYPESAIRSNILAVKMNFSSATNNALEDERTWMRVFLVCEIEGSPIYFHLWLYDNYWRGADLGYEWEETNLSGEDPEWGRKLDIDNDEYILLPVEGATLLYIGVEWYRRCLIGLGAPPYPDPPDYITGDTFTIEHMEVCSTIIEE